MSWLSRLLGESELRRARAAADEARERTDEEASRYERWVEELGDPSPATRAAAQACVAAARSAFGEGDLPGFLRTREQYEQALRAYREGRAKLARARPGGAAVNLLSAAKEAAGQIRDPEARSLESSHIGELQAHVGELEAARTTLEEIGEPADRASLLRAIAIAQCAAGRLEAARAVAGEIDEDWSREEALLLMAEDLCRRGDAAAARRIAGELEDPDLRARAWRAIAAAEAQGGHLEQAMSTARGIEDPAWAAASWSDIALAQAVAGDLAQGLETARGIEDPEWRWIALAELAGEHARRGNLAAADETMREIEGPQYREEALARVVQARAEKGDLDGALRAAEGFATAPARARALATIAITRKNSGDLENARALLARSIELAEEAAFSRDMSERQRALPGWLIELVVDARVALGEYESAESAAAVIQFEQERARLLGRLALAHGHAGDLLALEDLLERHPGVLERAAILRSGAAGFLSLAREAKNDTGTREAGTP